IDNLRAAGSGAIGGGCDAYPAPSVKALVSQVAKGQAIPLGVVVRPAGAGPIPSLNIQVQATNGGVTTLVSFPARLVDSATNTLAVRIASDAFDGDVTFRAQVAVPGCPYSPFGEPAVVKVVIAPASFVSLV